MDVLKLAIDHGDLAPLDRAVFDRIVATGAFDDLKIELLEGVLVPMRPQGAPHSHTVKQLMRLLDRALADRADVLVQSPFAAGPRSEPEPDVQVVPPGEYATDHPARAHLIIEVAVTSQRRDRGTKADVYARADVAAYWLVDVPAETVTVFADAADGRWATVTTHGRDAVLAVPGFPDVQVRVADVLPSGRR